ncbi:MAG TPA: vWA domain-containing protein [Candidatus Paceibacterota bacterium]|nr:vWA domain-containing protein [Candidatus Paceibacterota bacterium]
MIRWWAFWRRLQYGTVYIVLCGLVVSGIYMKYGYVAPTCFDGIQNTDERGVDCGGSCARICAFDVEPLRVVWAESFKIVEGQYNVVAYVENPNIIAGTPELTYTFRLYDGKGLIVEREGKTAMPIDGTYPLFEGRVMTGDRVPTRTELAFADDTVWLPGSMGTDQFSLIKRELVSADKTPRLMAQVENVALEEARDVEIVATIFDSKKKPLTASRTIVQYFSGRSTQDVTFTWPEPIAKTLRSCEVPSDVVLAIDLSGSMNNDGGNPSEPIHSVLVAAEAFVRRLLQHDSVGLVTFATRGELMTQLTNQRDDVARVISKLTISPDEERGSTNTGEAIMRAHDEINSSRHNENARKVVVILSDGLATSGGDDPEQFAKTSAQKLKDSGVEVFTIGLGAGVNDTFLRDIASGPQYYYKAPSSKDVDSMYARISEAICEDGASVIEVIPKVKSNFPVWP